PPPQLAAYGILENDQRGLRPFRGHAPRGPGRRMREALHFRRRIHGQVQPRRALPSLQGAGNIAVAAPEKQRRDGIETVELISRGTPAVPVATGGDGGMNPTFLAAVRSNRDPGAVIRTASGTIPAHVNPPEGNGDDSLSFARAPVT